MSTVFIRYPHDPPRSHSLVIFLFDPSIFWAILYALFLLLTSSHSPYKITLPSHEVFVPLTHPVIVGHTTTNHRAIREDESSPEALWPKLKELEELAEDHCIHPGLQDVLDLLDPTDCVDEEEDDGEEDEDEEGYEEEDEDNAHQAQP